MAHADLRQSNRKAAPADSPGLFYGLTRLDCSITVQGGDTPTIYITVRQKCVQITLDRVQTRRRSTLDSTNHDHLKFSIVRAAHSETERASWIDSDAQPLERQLTAIAVEIIVAGELQYSEHLVWVYEDRVRRREQARQEAMKRQPETERQSKSASPGLRLID